MSLINNMLKNLEERKKEDTFEKNSTAAEISSVPSEPSAIKKVVEKLTKTNNQVSPEDPSLLSNNRHMSKHTMLWRVSTLLFIGLLIGAYLYITTSKKGGELFDSSKAKTKAAATALMTAVTQTPTTPSSAETVQAPLLPAQAALNTDNEIKITNTNTTSPQTGTTIETMPVITANKITNINTSPQLEVEVESLKKMVSNSLEKTSAPQEINTTHAMPTLLVSKESVSPKATTAINNAKPLLLASNETMMPTSANNLLAVKETDGHLVVTKEIVLPKAMLASNEALPPIARAADTPVNNKNTEIKSSVPQDVLDNIKIQREKQLTTVLLHLSEETHYRVGESEGILSIKLAEMGKINALEIPDLENSGLNSIITSEQEQDLLIQISMLEGTKYNAMKYRGEDGDTLEISFDTTNTVKSLRPASKATILIDQNKEAADNAQNGGITKHKATTPLERADTNYHDAIALLREGNIDSGIDKLESIIKSMPDYSQARESLIIYYLDHGEQLKAELLLKSGLEQSPHSVTFALLKVRLFVEKDQLEKADETISAISADPKNTIEFYTLTGVINLRLKKFLSAQRAYEALIELEPNNGRWWLGLGIASQALGNNNVATEAYTQARRLGNTDWHVQAYLIKQLHTLKD